MPNPRRSPAIAQIIAARDAWRKVLLAGYEPTADRLIAAYQRTLTRLKPYETAVTTELLRRAEQGETITADDVRGLSQWSQLLVQVEIELNAFARLADSESSAAVDQAVTLGAQQARQLTLFTLPPAIRPRLDAAFVEPDPEALRRLVDYVDAPAMQQIVTAFGATAVQAFADMTLSGFAQGKHPVTMARAMSKWIQGVPLSWAANNTRTTYLYSYRGANQATYAANSQLLDGWVWWATLDGRTCLSCWDRHGRRYPVTEGLNDHHSGRCTPIPLVAGTTWYSEILTGPQEFERLPDTERRAALGSPQLVELYEQGKLPWGTFSKPYQHDVFGEMLRAATVAEILRAAS